jgi:hypothetical protein
MGIFRPAIDEMNQSKKWYREPQSFWQYLKEKEDYLKANNLKKPRTPTEVISIDSLSKLKKELRDSNTMVIRLGKSDDKRSTQFALIQAEGENLKDFFFIDSEVFSGLKPEFFQPADINGLYAFNLLPSLTESSYVNLAIFSGLITRALELDEGTLSSPATAKNSQYTFEVKPRSSETKIWEHKQGQVEIDAIFTAKKNGKPTVIIIESKVGRKFDSLSKHKLLYPYKALRKKIPDDMNIILVYLRVIKREGNIYFYLIEAVFRDNLIALDSLIPYNPKIFMTNHEEDSNGH